MRNIRLFLVVFALVVCAQLSAQSITPAPAIVRGGVCNGEVCVPATPFGYKQSFKLSFVGVEAVDAQRLEAAAVAAGLDVKRVKKRAKSGYLHFEVKPEMMPNDEGYAIVTTDEGVIVTANTAAGAFYAIQTMRQMVESGEWQTGIIGDYPRFAYRGVLVDISRHFRTVGVG